jgi:glycosyltransferase involved in cell wall biosynthesis
MNILIVSQQAGTAGSTFSISYLAKGLSERHSVWVACPPDTVLWQLLKEAAIQRVPINITGKLHRKSIRQIAQLVGQHDIEIVNAQSSRDRYVTILAKWYYRLPCKLVHTRRQLSKSMGILGQSLFYERGTDKIVAVSEGVKQSLVGIGIRPQHIRVIYNGTPIEKYAHIDRQRVAALRQQYQIADDDVVIGSVARLKEQDQILRALETLPFRVKVIFVGIRQQPEYEAFIRRFAIPHEVHFTGSIDNETTLHYYPLFRMNVLASTMEGLSQSLLEAMAMGVPVIATRLGGNPELIKHGTNGLLFDNNNIAQLRKCIERLASDDALHHQLSVHGKKTALADFSIDNTVQRHEALFQDLIN